MIIVIPSVLGFIVFILISFIIYILKNPEKLDKWSYLYNKLKINKSENSEKKVISKNIDYKITSIAKKINNEAQGIIPFGIRIKWRDTNEIDSYVKNNNVIVVLKKEDNCDKNIVETCIAFVPKALLPKSRNCIDSKTLKSIDNYMVKSILNSGTYDSAYNYFMTNFFNQFIQSDDDIENNIKTIDKLNEIGFFTRILLEEYRRVGIKLYGTNEEQTFHQESKDFLEFLKKLSNRKTGEYSQLVFTGQRIKIALTYVAKKATYYKGGLKPYLDRIDKNIKQGVQRIFVLSYAQSYDEIITNSDGYVKGTRSKKDFRTLNLLEAAIRRREDLKLIKKQKYHSKDIHGNSRSAKYILYEVIR